MVYKKYNYYCSGFLGLIESIEEDSSFRLRLRSSFLRQLRAADLITVLAKAVYLERS